MKRELEYAKMLESVGLSREQAETHLKVIGGAMTENFATKLDLYEFRTELKEDIQSLKIDFKDLKTDFKVLKNDFSLRFVYL